MATIGNLDLTHKWTNFAYGNVVASGLGITRVSDGSRFNENLLPTQTHRTATVPGRKGTYYFGSDSTQLSITVNYAFDHLNDRGIQELAKWVRSEGIHDLAFDNGDYYRDAKITSASLKYIPFEPSGDEYIDPGTGKTNYTIYKGEGTIQFTCYDPTKYIWSTPEGSDLNGILLSLDGQILTDIEGIIIVAADEIQGVS